jgi:hypothetical protein
VALLPAVAIYTLMLGASSATLHNSFFQGFTSSPEPYGRVSSTDPRIRGELVDGLVFDIHRLQSGRILSLESLGGLQNATAELLFRVSIRHLRPEPLPFVGHAILRAAFPVMVYNGIAQHAIKPGSRFLIGLELLSPFQRPEESSLQNVFRRRIILHPRPEKSQERLSLLEQPI